MLVRKLIESDAPVKIIAKTLSAKPKVKAKSKSKHKLNIHNQ